jgi:LysM repeat protein
MNIPTTWQAIYNLNRDQIKNPDLIYPGQILQMPGGGSYSVVNGDYLIKIAAGNGGGVYDPAIDKPAKSSDPASSSSGTAGAKKPVTVGPGSGYQADGTYRVESSGVTEPANDDAGKSGIQVGTAKPVIGPGKRQFNPLSKLSSYNYHLTLYMVTPEAYSEFLNNNQVDPSGFTIVAESGGINRKTNKNVAGFDRDVYIDDLSLKTFVGMKSNDGPTTDSVDFEFKIYEPYGFGFVSELKKLSHIRL